MWIETTTSKPKSVVVLTIIAVVGVGCGSSPDADGWQTRSINKAGTVSGCPGGTVVVGPPKQLGRQVRIRIVDRLCENVQFRIVAVDREERIRVGERTVGRCLYGKLRCTQVVFSGMQLKDLKEFRLQSRPYQQQTVRVSRKSSLAASAAQKARLIKAATEGDLFASNYFN
jgi:hypothetical protein